MGVVRNRKQAAAGRLDDAAGFAAVDALVALTLLSTTLVLALQAVFMIQKTTTAAVEARRAHAVLDYLMTSRRPTAGEWSGVSRGLGWSLAIQHEGAAQDAVCRRQAQAKSQVSGRRYKVSTLEPCPLEGAG